MEALCNIAYQTVYDELLASTPISQVGGLQFFGCRLLLIQYCGIFAQRKNCEARKQLLLDNARKQL
jgi:hypothetical protein